MSSLRTCYVRAFLFTLVSSFLNDIILSLAQYYICVPNRKDLESNVYLVPRAFVSRPSNDCFQRSVSSPIRFLLEVNCSPVFARNREREGETRLPITSAAEDNWLTLVKVSLNLLHARAGTPRHRFADPSRSARGGTTSRGNWYWYNPATFQI